MKTYTDREVSDLFKGRLFHTFLKDKQYFKPPKFEYQYGYDILSVEYIDNSYDETIESSHFYPGDIFKEIHEIKIGTKIYCEEWFDRNFKSEVVYLKVNHNSWRIV